MKLSENLATGGHAQGSHHIPDMRGQDAMPQEHVTHITVAKTGDRSRESDLPVISAKDFYLAPPSEADCRAVESLAREKSFFFAPFNNALKKGMPSFTAAAQVVFGENKHDVIKVVRLRETDQFLGCIRFTDVKRGEAEISYFFDPRYYKKRLGTQSILRAVEWAMPTLGLRKLHATVDPDNFASFKILKRIGLKVVQEGYALPEESPYAGQRGEKRPRLIMRGRYPHDILPALSEAKRSGQFSLDTLVS